MVQIDDRFNETILDDTHINEGDLIDFALTCRVEKDSYDAYTDDYDDWWDYYFELDRQGED